VEISIWSQCSWLVTSGPWLGLADINATISASRLEVCSFPLVVHALHLPQLVFADVELTPVFYDSAELAVVASTPALVVSNSTMFSLRLPYSAQCTMNRSVSLRLSEPAAAAFPAVVLDVLPDSVLSLSGVTPWSTGTHTLSLEASCDVPLTTTASVSIQIEVVSTAVDLPDDSFAAPRCLGTEIRRGNETMVRLGYAGATWRACEYQHVPSLGNITESDTSVLRVNFTLCPLVDAASFVMVQDDESMSALGSAGRRLDAC
jgi:hypothetical protein